MPNEILEVSGVNKSYGGVHALRGAGFTLDAGEVHALMGENGAGKSTLSKIIAGAVESDAGEIFVAGQRVDIAGPLQAQRLGISIIFQELDLFPNLSIAENLVIANNEFAEGAMARLKDMDSFAPGWIARPTPPACLKPEHWRDATRDDRARTQYARPNPHHGRANQLALP